MNVLKKIGMWFISMSLIINLCGCNKLHVSTSSELFKNSNSKDSDYDICFYNIVGEYGDELENLVKSYESETGVKIRIVSTTSYDDYVDEVAAQLSDKSTFAIFSVRGVAELERFVKDGIALALSNVKSEYILNLVKNNSIKYLLRSHNDVYGIPIGLDAHSYFIDKSVVKDLVGEGNVDKFIADMKAASYESFASFVQDADKYFKGEGVTGCTLNGRSYIFNNTKSDKLQNISSTFLDVLYEETMNAYLNKSFRTQSDVFHATKDTISNLDFTPVSKALSVQSESVDRGNASKDSLLKVLEDVMNSENRENFVPIPIKLDVQDSELNSSICVGGQGYFVLNSKLSDKDQKLAQDFITWICKCPDTSLGKFDKVVSAKSEIDKYISSGLVLNQVSYGLPYALMGYVSQYISNSGDFSDYVKNKWKDLQ